MSHRTQITLTDEQYELLRSEARRRGLGLSELIRRAVDRSYGTVDRDEQRAALQESFASWSDGDDGASYVEALRPGMEQRLADADG
jgi:hypothetical protein